VDYINVESVAWHAKDNRGYAAHDDLPVTIQFPQR
jgi:hypothetical protein